MTSTSKPRGRPRAYEPDVALAQARDAFWEKGFAATSLDELSAATGMQRPSLYAAFGDKAALFLRTLERYAEASRAALETTLAPGGPLREALQNVFSGAIAFYASGEGGARGCFLLSTATSEAMTNPPVRSLLAETFAAFDRLFEQRLRSAQRDGELSRAADASALSRLATAVLHTLALRARAGESRRALERIAGAGIDAICGTGRAAKRAPRAGRRPERG